MLKQVECGEVTDDEFMRSIEDFTKKIIAENNTPKPEYLGLFGNNDRSTNANPPLGACPRCAAPVREAEKGFFCDTPACGFKLWKDSKFWTAKKKRLTAKIVTALLKDGQIALKGLYSAKTGKTYDATIILDDDGEKFVNYKMEFK